MIAFKRLIPILFVKNLRAERDFYMNLGFNITYQANELPDFIALNYDDVEFGLEVNPTFDPNSADQVMVVQFGIEDVDGAIGYIKRTTLPFKEERVTIGEHWRYRVLHIRTPNGYHVLLEGPKELASLPLL